MYTMEPVLAKLEEVLAEVGQLKSSLDALVRQRAVKDWYEVEEVAQILGKRPYTVRAWCREGRIHARKKQSGRGKFPAWAISHEELLRIQQEGLLPLKPAYAC